jgi:hypothetical protein
MYSERDLLNMVKEISNIEIEKAANFQAMVMMVNGLKNAGFKAELAETIGGTMEISLTPKFDLAVLQEIIDLFVGLIVKMNKSILDAGMNPDIVLPAMARGINLKFE